MVERDRSMLPPTRQSRRRASLLVPYFATVHSAYGAALSDIRFSPQFSEPIVLPNDAACA